MTPDVLFGQAYFLRFDPKLWAAEQPYAPLGALYAAAYVREAGYTVEFFDAMLAASEAEWMAALDRHRPRVAVIYEDSFNYLSKMCLLRMRDAALNMVAAARSRGAVAIVAGSDASDHPAVYLDAGADAIVVGEGEETLKEALGVLTGRSAAPLTGVQGLCFRHADGQLVRTPRRGFIKDLDALPRPAWDLVDVERYRNIWIARHGYFSMNVATTRGCPYHCNWCAKPIYGQRYSTRSPGAVVAEIDFLRRAYRPDHLWIADDIFGLKPGWIQEFARLMAERTRVPFKCLLRADGVTADVARALAVAGCRTVWIGAESGSQRILDAMEKGIRVDQIVSAVDTLREEGIEIGFFLQFGYPGETLEDIERTLQMVRDCRPDDIGISVSYPLPGTRFHDRVRSELGEKQNWIDSADLAVMFRATYPPEFYRSLHSLVHAEFRFKRAVQALARARTTPGMLLSSVFAKSFATGVVQALRIPLLRRQVRAFAELGGGHQAMHPFVPLLTRQAAASPTEQPQ